MLHSGVPCWGIEWIVVECDATELNGFLDKNVPSLPQWNSVELVGMLENGVESCGMERKGM